jgi:rubrerythrin
VNAVEIAIKMETDAITFYREAATTVKNAVGQKMFLSIMDDEKRHLDMLKEILEGLDIHIRDVSPMKNLKTIFEEHKGEMMQRTKVTTDELDAFKIAMRMEREGVEFYKKRSSEAPSEKEKMLFERLAKEEEQHYAVFSNTYFFMQDSGNWFMWEEHSFIDGGTLWA